MELNARMSQEFAAAISTHREANTILITGGGSAEIENHPMFPVESPGPELHSALKCRTILGK